MPPFRRHCLAAGAVVLALVLATAGCGNGASNAAPLKSPTSEPVPRRAGDKPDEKAEPDEAEGDDDAHRGPAKTKTGESTPVPPPAPAPVLVPAPPGLESDPDWPELQGDVAALRPVLDAYWAATLPALAGEAWTPLADLVAYRGGDGPACGGVTAEPANALYCPGTDVISFDAAWFLSNMKSELGDGSVAFILAHEWGHAVQRRIGGPESPLDLEQQADCYAGAALQSAADVGTLLADEGDADEVIATLYAVRDEAGTPWSDPSAHGSAAERIGAYLTGADGGAAACPVAYPAD